MYKIGNVRRNKEEGDGTTVLADLLNEDGSVKLRGSLRDVIRICEERRYETSNIEQAKIALVKMCG